MLDAGYGKEPALLRALDAAGECFLVEVHRFAARLDGRSRTCREDRLEVAQRTSRHAAGWSGITTWPWLMLAMQFQLRERILHAQEHPLLSTAEEVMAQLLRRYRKRKSSIACRQQRPSR